MTITSLIVLLLLLELSKLKLAVSRDPVDDLVDGFSDFEAFCAQLLEGISYVLHLFDATYPANGQVVDRGPQKLCLRVMPLVHRKHL